MNSAGPRVTHVASRPGHSFSKTLQDAITLVAGLGVEGDSHAGATVQRDGSESEAFLTLPPADRDSRVTQMVEQHYAELDYRLKVQAKHFWDALKQVQEVRRGVQEARGKSAQ